MLYLGEINSSQERAWRKSIEVLDEAHQAPRTLALFPEDRCEAVVDDESIVRLKLSALRLERPRQWGGCWVALSLWRELKLDGFSQGHALGRGAGDPGGLSIALAGQRVAAAPEWYGRSALSDLLGADDVVDSHALYACHDRLLEHKAALFDHLISRWREKWTPISGQRLK